MMAIDISTLISALIPSLISSLISSLILTLVRRITVVVASHMLVYIIGRQLELHSTCTCGPFWSSELGLRRGRPSDIIRGWIISDSIACIGSHFVSWWFISYLLSNILFRWFSSCILSHFLSGWFGSHFISNLIFWWLSPCLLSCFITWWFIADFSSDSISSLCSRLIAYLWPHIVWRCLTGVLRRTRGLPDNLRRSGRL